MALFSNKKELGIDFNFHSLRHTHATMLLEDGVKPKIVQERLGHSRIATKMDKYVHVTRKMKTEAVDIFAQRLKNPLKDKNCRPFKFMGDNRRMF